MIFSWPRNGQKIRRGDLLLPTPGVISYFYEDNVEIASILEA